MCACVFVLDVDHAGADVLGVGLLGKVLERKARLFSVVILSHCEASALLHKVGVGHHVLDQRLDAEERAVARPGHTGLVWVEREGSPLTEDLRLCVVRFTGLPSFRRFHFTGPSFSERGEEGGREGEEKRERGEMDGALEPKCV